MQLILENILVWIFIRDCHPRCLEDLVGMTNLSWPDLTSQDGHGIKNEQESPLGVANDA